MTENARNITHKEVKITDFPPVLRKVIEYVAENHEYEHMKDLCEQAGINYDTYRSTKLRCNKQGLFVDDYIASIRDIKLKRKLHLVDSSMIKQALKGSTPAAKLLYMKQGEIKEGRGGDQTNIQINFIQPATIPTSEILDITEDSIELGSNPQDMDESPQQD